MEPDFSPQLIQFGKTESTLQRPAPEAGQQTPEKDSPWRQQYELQLRSQESLARAQWLQERNKKLKSRFATLIEQAENPANWKASPTQSTRQILMAELLRLREQLQQDFMPLLPRSSEPTPQQRYLTAQLTKLDALRFRNLSAYEKSREAAAPYKGLLINLAVLPEELLALVELDRLLDAVIRYQLTLEVALSGKGKLEQHLTTLQEIALTGLREPKLPTANPVSGTLWHWKDGRLRNDLGVSLKGLRYGYNDWLRRGLKHLQTAIKQEFSQPELLLKALECFYCAHSVERERAESLVFLAWLLTLLNQPVLAVDCLEMALRRNAMIEIKELFWLVQSLDPANQLLPSVKKPEATANPPEAKSA